MIRMLERHIAKTILITTALILVLITGILSLMLLLNEFKNIGAGDYGLWEALLYVLLRLPNELYQFSPLLILLGCIAALSVLSSQRELAVMRASGFSIRHIIYSVFVAAIFLIVGFTIMGEGLGPDLSYKALVRKENAENAEQAVVTAAGVWFHVDNNFMHVKHIVSKEVLEGVTRYQFDDKHQLEAAYFAKTLVLKNHQWMMQNVLKTNFYHERTKSHTYESLPLDLKFNSNLLNIGVVEPSQMPLVKVFKLSTYLQKNGLQAGEYQFDFWKRMLQPLASLIMVFLAIPFVLGALHNASTGWRILLGILLGFSFFILNALLGQLSVVYQVPAFVAAALPIVLFGLAGGWLCNKLIRR